MILSGRFPSHSENRMKIEGNVEAAREFFLSVRPNNLSFLVALGRSVVLEKS